MKRLMITAAVISLSSTVAFAGNLESPWDRPPLIEPAKPQLSWGGLYGGVGITTKRDVNRTVTEVPDGHEKKCPWHGNNHSEHKCYVSVEDWNNSPELTALPIVQNPWSTATNEIARYGTNGIWLGTHEDLIFTSANNDQGNWNRSPEYLGEVFTDVVTLDEDESIIANIFAGYRHVFENGFAGGIELGSVGGAELQTGISTGRVFAYGGFNTDEEVTLGVDVLVGSSGMFFGGKLANGDLGSRGELRVGFSF